MNNCSGAFYEAFTNEINNRWVLDSGYGVFFMQTGFAMLEIGSIRFKNAQNLLKQKIMTIYLSILGFWAFGYALSYGDHISQDFPVFGSNYFFLDGVPEEYYVNWFFSFTFCAVACTIITGAVAERSKPLVIYIFAFAMSAFFYPIVVHLFWSKSGYFYPQTEKKIYLLDFAGSAVVHFNGGVAALVACLVIGPREKVKQNAVSRSIGKEFARIRKSKSGILKKIIDVFSLFFIPEAPIIPGYSVVFTSLGVIILWFGWFGFNPGSSTEIVRRNVDLSARISINTAITPCFSGFTVFLVYEISDKYYDFSRILNGILVGAISITGGCAFVSPGYAALIGIIGAFIYLFACRFVPIDDPVDAFCLHGIGGAWGVIGTGLFYDQTYVQNIYDDLSVSRIPQIGAQLFALVIIFVIIGMLTYLLLFLINAVYKLFDFFRRNGYQEIKSARRDSSSSSSLRYSEFRHLKYLALEDENILYSYEWEEPFTLKFHEDPESNLFDYGELKDSEEDSS